MIMSFYLTQVNNPLTTVEQQQKLIKVIAMESL